ncbi:hypothetical protein C8R44DRAFT_911385, partial [Mycena epipterygia]
PTLIYLATFPSNVTYSNQGPTTVQARLSINPILSRIYLHPNFVEESTRFLGEMSCAPPAILCKSESDIAKTLIIRKAQRQVKKPASQVDERTLERRHFGHIFVTDHFDARKDGAQRRGHSRGRAAPSFARSEWGRDSGDSRAVIPPPSIAKMTPSGAGIPAGARRHLYSLGVGRGLLRLRPRGILPQGISAAARISAHREWRARPASEPQRWRPAPSLLARRRAWCAWREHLVGTWRRRTWASRGARRRARGRRRGLREEGLGRGGDAKVEEKNEEGREEERWGRRGEGQEGSGVKQGREDRRREVGGRTKTERTHRSAASEEGGGCSQADVERAHRSREQEQIGKGDGTGRAMGREGGNGQRRKERASDGR